MIDIDLKRLFDSDKGRVIYREFLRAISDFSMKERIAEGVLVGFSGGADSVMLLALLVKYASENDLKPPVAVHLNHLIRGAEADRDEAFSRDFCHALGVEFLAFRRDVPTEAKRLSKGIEETARIIRYSVFEDLISGRNDINCIAVAHNATDNLETVIFNMMRGAGTRGLSGISPVRDNIIRPLIYSPKRDIVETLQSASVPFVTDSTNSETDYKRNYIRSEIIPKLFALTDNPEAQAARLSSNLRADDFYIESVARKFLDSFGGGEIPKDAISSLDYAVFFRVVSAMAKEKGIYGVESVHVTKIYELLRNGKGDFSLSLPGEVCFICRGGICFIDKPDKITVREYEKKLELGVNYVDEIDAEVIISDKPIEYSSKVYKIAIQESFDFDIIEGELFVRKRRDGDSYVYGGITRKLKKLFNDKSVEPQKRDLVPIFCDNLGILWVPGFRVRDGAHKNSQRRLYVAVAYKI